MMEVRIHCMAHVLWCVVVYTMQAHKVPFPVQVPVVACNHACVGVDIRLVLQQWLV